MENFLVKADLQVEELDQVFFKGEHLLLDGLNIGSLGLSAETAIFFVLVNVAGLRTDVES